MLNLRPLPPSLLGPTMSWPHYSTSKPLEGTGLKKAGQLRSVKAVILVDDGKRARYLVQIKKSAQGPTCRKDGKLEFAGGGVRNKSKSPAKALSKELLEEDRTSLLAYYFKRAVHEGSARYRVVTDKNGQKHFLFSFRVSELVAGFVAHCNKKPAAAHCRP